MANKITGKAVQFQVDDGVGNYTTLAQVTGITPPGETMATVDTTTMDDGGVKQIIAGINDFGQGSVDVVYDPADAGVEGLRADLRAGTHRKFKIIFPAPVSKTWSLTAILTGISPSVPLEDKLTSTISFELDGTSSAIA